jgi:LytS/YehU family sensor histidine kinase
MPASMVATVALSSFFKGCETPLLTFIIRRFDDMRRPAGAAATHPLAGNFLLVIVIVIAKTARGGVLVTARSLASLLESLRHDGSFRGS